MGTKKKRMGILLCGLNGVGKSTLGRALAERLHMHFIDNEDLYFPKTDPGYLYAAPRTRDEAEALLLREIRTHERFVFTSVRGDYDEALPYFHCAVLLSVPREQRLERVRNRSFQKFGDRIHPGGDLYEQEAQFFALVESRAEDTVENWLRGFREPVIRLDGTRPITENVDHIIAEMENGLE